MNPEREVRSHAQAPGAAILSRRCPPCWANPEGEVSLHAQAPGAAVAGEALPVCVRGTVGAVLRCATGSCEVGQVHRLGRLLPMGGWTVHMIDLQNTLISSVQI